MKKYFLGFVLAIILPSFVSSASSDGLKVSVSKSGVAVGDNITVSVFAQTPQQAINAVSGTLVYSSNLGFVGVEKIGSIIDFWTQEPSSFSGKIKFEGVALNPGYQGNNGKIFTANFVAKKSGSANIYLSDGAILANDGFGTNILGYLGKTNLQIIENNGISELVPFQESGRLVALPVITEYSEHIFSLADQSAFLKGIGEPNALTKIVFKDTSFKSVGERFIEFVQTKKKKLDEVLVKNDSSGTFQYTTANNLLAGAYNATPFLVDENTNTERVGLGVQLLVNDSAIVKNLVVLINVLALLIPVVGLVIIIYFIPWYSFKRMRVLKRKLGLEEEEIELTEHRLKKEDNML